MFDVATGRQLFAVPSAAGMGPPSFNSDGTRLACSEEDLAVLSGAKPAQDLYGHSISGELLPAIPHFVAVHDSHSGKELFQIPEALCVAYDGKRPVTLDIRDRLCFHDPNTGKVLRVFERGAQIAPSPLGTACSP